ncbi:type II toxin-antitoxin system RelE/ParE family toxin [Pseudacidovorax intermedius]|uniref:ParE-like toxin of type II ParDE toxin-antitoxin system n=1 Tax=Pseudacidovorax intermedius TaxID=433924 RepID=A0A370F2Z5_9BURK|nr:type II toxin-antitoxin system RelE/ParE family toxin [Pseudacidovorax intermedius]RDI17021.1 ParE-like toxin of type II ParDE toxin-antitoxin system [Pseudacidovorax intermedius]
MGYTVRLTPEALEDLQRLEDFLVDAALNHGDFDLPGRAMDAIQQEFAILRRNPFTCRIAFDDRLERELVIPFGGSGYVALFQIESDHDVVVTALRHQREDDYH